MQVTQPPSQSITSLTLVNTDTDTDIRTLNSTDTVDIANNGISIRANTDPATVGSVVFTLDGSPLNTENSAPYATPANNGSDYLSWNIAPGTYTLTATPYSEANGGGTAGTPLSVTLEITNGNQSPTAVASASPQNITLANVSDTETITLDGTSSSDPDSSPNPLTYAWYFGTDTTATPIATTATTNLTLGAGSHTYTLVVDDGADTASATVTITVNDPPTGPTVTALTLINATTNTVIAPLSELSTTTVNIDTQSINIQAETSPTVVGSVIFDLTNDQTGVTTFNYRTENIAPYAIADNDPGAYDPWIIDPGTYTITATAYTGSHGTGNAGVSIQRTIQVDSSGANVTGFVLVNADTDIDIGQISDGDVIDMSGQNINIRLETSAEVGSVVMDVNYKRDSSSTTEINITPYRTENIAPYALGENASGGVFEPWYTTPGYYTITATSYSQSDGIGVAGTPVSVSFTLTNSNPTCGGLTQEAEDGIIVTNARNLLIVADDPIASGGQYIHRPDNTVSGWSLQGSDRAIYCFDLPEDGTYRLRMWGYTPDDNSDSFHVQVNDDVNLWDMSDNTTYAEDYLNNRWISDPTEYVLTAGPHYVTVYPREDGARLDKLEFELLSDTPQVVERICTGCTVAFTDSNGDVWSADTHFTDGQANNLLASDIIGTTDDGLYDTERSAITDAGTFSYSIPVTNGTYTVRLHFAEIYFTGESGMGGTTNARGLEDTGSPPRRVFDVVIEGTTVLDEFNVATSSGGARTAHIETFTVSVTDGILNIEFPPATTNRPTIAAIEILQ